MTSFARADFTRGTFAALLHSESLRCIRTSVRDGSLSPVPEVVVYYCSGIDHRREYSADHSEVVVPPATLLTAEELLPHLFREEDGHYRRWIVLAPFAVAGGKTVIDLTIRDPDWTNEVITGDHAFPHEPFQLSGPALPASWRAGDPTPRVTLPALRTGSVPIAGQTAEPGAEAAPCHGT